MIRMSTNTIEAAVAQGRRLISDWNLLRICANLAMPGITILAMGCGAAIPDFPTATLKGIVTIDKKPVQDGSLQFVPQTNVRGQVAQARIVDGAFIAKRVPVGKVRVMFNITRATGKMITEYSSSHPEIEDLLPAQYREGIELTVTGDDHLSFDLVSDSDDKNPEGSRF